jgi:hypothetical protein
MCICTVHTTLLYGFSNETVAIYSTIQQDGIISFAFVYIVIDNITCVSVVDLSGNELLGQLQILYTKLET